MRRQNRLNVRHKNNTHFIKSVRFDQGALLIGLRQLMLEPLGTLLTLSTLVMVLSFTLLTHIVSSYLDQYGTQKPPQLISLFLKDGISESQARELVAVIEQNQSIDQVNLLSAEETLNEFKQYSGFGDALVALTNNPLPIVIEVVPKYPLSDDKRFDTIVNNLRSFSEVDFVQDDTVWQSRLQSVIAFSDYLARILVLLSLTTLGLFCAKSVYWHIRTQTLADESLSLPPLIAFGCWLGALSGLLSCSCVAILLSSLNNALDDLSLYYQIDFHIPTLTFADFTTYIAMSTSIAGLSAVVSAHFYRIALKKK